MSAHPSDSCDEKIAGKAENNGPDLVGAILLSRIVDLSHPISTSIPVWPGDPPPAFESWSDIDRDGYYLRRFSLSEHGGTHLTAPASFFADGKSVDEFAPLDLVKPAAVMDVRMQCRDNPDYTLSTADLLQWESLHGPVPAGALFLLHTGWAERWHDPPAYLGTGPDGVLHFPGFGLDVAELLVNRRGVAGFGTDTAGAEPGIDDDFAVSRLALSNELLVLENLARLDELPPTGTLVVIGLLRLARGSGSPAAVTAFCQLENK